METKFNFNAGSLLTVLLTVVFVVLKLCGVIAWSWWWVLAPLWISAGLKLIIFGILFIVALIAASKED